MNLQKLRALVNTEVVWLGLMEWVEEQESIHLQNLKQAEKPELIYRTQGYLKALEKIRNLKVEVNAK